MMQMEMRGTILKIETVENGSDMKENLIITIQRSFRQMRKIEKSG